VEEGKKGRKRKKEAFFTKPETHPAEKRIWGTEKKKEEEKEKCF